MLAEPLLRQKLLAFLEEDLHFADVSSQIIPSDLVASGQIICKQGGIIAGVREALLVFSLVNVEAAALAKDGTVITNGDAILTVSGLARNILCAERTALNLLHRMSAIASTVRKAVELAQASNPKVRIAATRKTTPGFRAFEKQAVILGGGDPG